MDSQRLILFFVSLLGVPAGSMLAARQAAAATRGGGERQGRESAPSAAQCRCLRQAGAAADWFPSRSGRAQEADTTLRIETDLFIARIGTRGGDLRHLQFKQHRDTLDKNKDFVLFDSSPERTYIAQSGLIGAGLPNHHTIFKASGASFQLAEGQDRLEVRLTSSTADGVEVTKIYRFERGSYLIDVGYEIANKTAVAIQPYAYFQLVRDAKPPAGDSAMVPTFTGVAVYTEKEKFQKITFEEIDKGNGRYPKNSGDGWIAIHPSIFFPCVVAEERHARAVSTQRRLDETCIRPGEFIRSALSDRRGINACRAGTPGPRSRRKLEKIAPGLDSHHRLRLADGNRGAAVRSVVLAATSGSAIWASPYSFTVIIKLLFLSAVGRKLSLDGRWRVVAPKLQRLKDQYGDDRQRLQQAIDGAVQDEKINPLGGGMPILVQIPVFYCNLLGFAGQRGTAAHAVHLG